MKKSINVLAIVLVITSIITTTACNRITSTEGANNSNSEKASESGQGQESKSSEADSQPSFSFNFSHEEIDSENSDTNTEALITEDFNAKTNPKGIFAQNSKDKPEDEDIVKIGQKVHFDGTDTLFDKFEADIIIKNVQRGDSALKLVKKASPFNPEPEEGREYMVAQVLFELTDNSESDEIHLSPYFFSLVNGEDYSVYEDLRLIRNIEPSLEDVEIGESSLSYIAFQVDEADSNPYIVFLSRANDGIWFETNQNFEDYQDSEDNQG